MSNTIAQTQAKPSTATMIATALKEEPAITKPADQSKLKHEENSKQPMNMTTKQTATTKANSAKEKKGRVRETSPITR